MLTFRRARAICCPVRLLPIAWTLIGVPLATPSLLHGSAVFLLNMFVRQAIYQTSRHYCDFFICCFCHCSPESTEMSSGYTCTNTPNCPATVKLIVKLSRSRMILPLKGGRIIPKTLTWHGCTRLSTSTLSTGNTAICTTREFLALPDVTHARALGPMSQV